MNISIFNRPYLMRRYAPGGETYEDTTISIHLHQMENGSGQPWAETQGIPRHLSGHGMAELREADLEAGTKGDRVYYRGRWWECVSSVLYDHTKLAHYNYSFVAVPDDAIDVITLFNPVYDPESGDDIYAATVIRGVSWISSDTAGLENTGMQAASRYTIRIPEEADFSGKVFVEPVSFTGESGTFTLKPGDLIVRGEETETDVFAELQRKHRVVVKVMSVSDFRRAPNSRHWRVEGQ